MLATTRDGNFTSEDRLRVSAVCSRKTTRGEFLLMENFVCPEKDNFCPKQDRFAISGKSDNQSLLQSPPDWTAEERFQDGQDHL